MKARLQHCAPVKVAFLVISILSVWIVRLVKYRAFVQVVTVVPAVKLYFSLYDRKAQASGGARNIALTGRVENNSNKNDNKNTRLDIFGSHTTAAATASVTTDDISMNQIGPVYLCLFVSTNNRTVSCTRT